MKINSKIQLQRKFNTISGVQANSLLRFKSDGNLEAVSQNYQGLLPQIKVIANSNSTVSCKTSSNVTVSLSANYNGTDYYFNVPGLGTYSITINSGTAHSITVKEYKQYIYNTL